MCEGAKSYQFLEHAEPLISPLRDKKETTVSEIQA